MLSSFHIKLLAFTLMLIDHLGRLFFPEVTIMVALGRLSFPLFAWLAAQGEKYTSNIWKYVFRLILLGIISQPIYAHIWNLLFSEPAPLNILFSLAAGAIVVRLSKLSRNIVVELLIVALLTAMLSYAHIEGGTLAIFTVYLMSKYKSNNAFWWVTYILFYLLYVSFFKYHIFKLISAFAPLILIAYNREQGIKARWFYLLYPFHFCVLAAIKWYLNP